MTQQKLVEPRYNRPADGKLIREQSSDMRLSSLDRKGLQQPSEAFKSNTSGRNAAAVNFTNT